MKKLTVLLVTLLFTLGAAQVSFASEGGAKKETKTMSCKEEAKSKGIKDSKEAKKYVKECKKSRKAKSKDKSKVKDEAKDKAKDKAE